MKNSQDAFTYPDSSRLIPVKLSRGMDGWRTGPEEMMLLGCMFVADLLSLNVTDTIFLQFMDISPGFEPKPEIAMFAC